MLELSQCGIVNPAGRTRWLSDGAFRWNVPKLSLSSAAGKWGQGGASASSPAPE